ncbi:MAG: NADH:ubiquinone reductase (Na(+)-transporting) subunit B [Candidatus Marinimicrobia bacterium]|nr:NADH:ubiquinone reductase (Na(+)-transporting) subunit B [Candidatus Neomarinimicrobiota bacterium]MCK9560271.1 NADH:ubiquinone reductase (Na(+)-transporting) subunit B [Candidatus Neomarinimicrobiota bacterium]
MGGFRKLLDKAGRPFHPGGQLAGLFYLFEAIDTFFYTPGKITRGAVHVRDFMDLKRMMITVFVALMPAVFMAFYNTGLQANLVLQSLGNAANFTWQQRLMLALGLNFDPHSFWSNFIHGGLYFIPVYIVTLAAGGFWEVLFAIIRKHEVAEGFFVTSLLFPLILPPTIPYWQVALGISFGVVIGKEVFGGVGFNIFNPALVARAFLFFAYPAQISGEKVWLAVDGISQATPLAQLAEPVTTTVANWSQAFLGFIPGSMGETSTLACLIGALILLVSGVGSWRIMLSILIGMATLSMTFNLIGSATNPMFAVTPVWHLVLGGFAFGTVFMATDPVSGAITTPGQWLYGLLIGFLVVMIRVLNPAFPEGMMLAILFANMFAPLIDRIFINIHIKRRMARNAV